MDSDDAHLRMDAVNSKTNLIDVQHVGVTAKIRTPLKRALPECSSADNDDIMDIFTNSCTKQYSKLSAEDTESTVPTTAPPLSATSTTESSKLLYEMHAEEQRTYRKPRTRNHSNAFSRIEFQLYNKQAKRLRHCKCQRSRVAKKRSSAAQKKRDAATAKVGKSSKGPHFFQRLRMSFKEICATKAQIPTPTFAKTKATARPPTTTTADATADAPADATADAADATADATAKVTNESMRQHDEAKAPKPGIGIYTFEHGCAEYLCATDCPPNVISNVLAERTTYFATRFWAEIFGVLHIGVAFLVTFLLQSYRFLLYSLVNTLLVGLLQMTSDYLLKPVLTVAFNGFLQPPLIFLFNTFSSIRDLLEPVADMINNFMKPIATVGRSVRLVQVNYNKKKFVKDV